MSNNRITNKVEKMKIRNKNGYLNYKNDSIKQLNNNDEFLMTQNVKEESYNKKSINIKNESFKKENKTDNSDIKNQKISNKKFMLKKKRKKQTLKFNKLKKEKNNCCSIIISKKEDDLSDMDYEDIIKNDNRTFIRMYWAYFVYSKINSGTFCTENNLNLFIIKLSFFLFTFEISLFFNAFFYSDEYISDAYYNNGILDFVSVLPKSIYSTIISYIISELLQTLSNSENELYEIIKVKTKFKNFERIINIKLKKLRNKLIVCYILIFLLELIFYILYQHFVLFIGVHKNIYSLDFLNILPWIL